MNMIDSHFHVWDRSRFPYDWLAHFPELNRDILPCDYRTATRSLHVTQSVFVEAYVSRERCVDEALWILSQARENEWIVGIVGAVYLESPHAAQDLRRLAEHKLFKGVRRLLDEEQDDDFPARPDFIRGVQILAQFGLPFDICIRHTQLRAAIELVKQSPGVRFVLDHCGKPNFKDAQWQPWADQISEFAGLRNTYCKMSGLVTEAGREKVAVEHLKPYIDHVVAQFGFERLMFGTDWPVCTMVSSPERWLEVLLAALPELTENQNDWLFRESCKRFYGL
jgi:L-fuconolactonase